MARQDEDDKRICPDDGKIYTFDDFEIAYCHMYDPSELDAKWEQMGKPEQAKLSRNDTVAVVAKGLALLADPKTVDTNLVKLAEKGDIAAVQASLLEGCDPDVFAFEYARYGGSKRVYCNDWTPLTAAIVAGRVDVVELLLSSRADINVVCCTTTASGSYKSWTALDCARTGETIPFERDPTKHLQPRHPDIEKMLLAAGAKPSSSCITPQFNTYGELPSEGQRPNPCIDNTGDSFKPEYLFSEAELRANIGQPSLVRGASCVTPLVTMGYDIASGAKVDRVYLGGCKVFQ